MQVLTPLLSPPSSPFSKTHRQDPNPHPLLYCTKRRRMFSKLFNSSSKKGDASKPFEGDMEGLWYLDGKAYDLSKFVKMHPGEEEQRRNEEGWNRQGRRKECLQESKRCEQEELKDADSSCLSPCC